MILEVVTIKANKLMILWRSFHYLIDLAKQGRIIFGWNEMRRHLSMDQNTVVMYLNPHTIFLGIVARYYQNPNIFFVYEGNTAVLLSELLHRRRDIESLNVDDSGIAFDLVKYLLAKGERILFSGGSDLEAIIFQERFNKQGLGIDCITGYDDDCLNKRSNEFSIIFLSLGSPLQEKRSIQVIKKKSVKHVICCGGFVSQLANSLGAIYPAWVVTLKLRFLYRMVTDIKIFRRMLSEYPLVYLCWLMFILNQRIRPT